ncbi:MAG: flagellar biosynthesis protein FlgN [Treponema sp.]|nr:flagellar biosynthesis protein FlgN [Treponema sp.]
MGEISPEELKKRVAIVKRFRELLIAQRERFNVYLETLEKQKSIMENGGVEDILAYVEMEEKMVSDIFSIQKVIVPLETQYRSHVGVAGSASGSDIPEIQTALERLRVEANNKVEQNRDLLEKRMNEFREALKPLRNNPYIKRKVSFATAESASFLDIEG